jgi:hypothetical protein
VEWKFAAEASSLARTVLRSWDDADGAASAGNRTAQESKSVFNLMFFFVLKFIVFLYLLDG